jgi:hypothetical protein
MARGTCPHCKRDFTRIDMHTVCVKDPTIRAWLAQNLPDPNAPRYILPACKFDQLNPPVSRGPLEDYYGTWRNLAAAFGLLMRTRARGERVMELDPDVAAELRRLADELHGGAFGPSTSEYDMYRSPGAIMTHGLQHRHGAWADVLALAGLRVGTMSEYQRASFARRKAHQANQNERGCASLERGDEPISREYTGLPVFPNPRQLPSGGVAWTVR